MKAITRYRIQLEDLELELDELIGYAPQGFNWQNEAERRKVLIATVLQDVSIPNDIKMRITQIQHELYKVRNSSAFFQGYIPFSEREYKNKRMVPVKDHSGVIDYIEI